MNKAEEATPGEAGPALVAVDAPTRIDPDLDFIRAIGDQAGDSFKLCFQCGTCSATCELSPETDPFPRKEMAWAAWGRKDRLLSDVDVWLCHQCNDCSTHCPRGGRPGDVLAAVRMECVEHYAFPRFLGRWVARPVYLPLLLAIPAVLLAAALLARDGIAEALGFTPNVGERIIFSYSRTFPHWLVNGFFFFFSFLASIAVVVGVVRFWRALKAGDRQRGSPPPVKSVPASILSAVRAAFTHERFAKCTTARTRYVSHLAVFFGFLALSVVALWVITCRINPLIPDGFVYPFDFWSPWKILANLGGLAILFGGAVMLSDRVRSGRPGGGSRYADWSLLALLLLVVLTGLLTETLHYLRLEPHRHATYFSHLAFVFALLMYLPYSKFAHMVYRITAMVYAEHIGRDLPRPPGGEPARPPAGDPEATEEESS